MKSPALQYFQNIFETAVSLFDGLAVTFSYLFQRPVTLEYPHKLKRPVQDTLPDRYRGFLYVEPDLCTSCDACAKACPIDCITLEGIKIPGKKGKAPLYFYIDMGKCMFCGLCVPPCPTDAIFFTKEFEGSVIDPANLIYSYVSEEKARSYIKEARAAAEELENSK